MRQATTPQCFNLVMVAPQSNATASDELPVGVAR